MLRKALAPTLAAVLSVLLPSSPAHAWGGYHAGYTAVGPGGGVYHQGATAVGGAGYGGAYRGGAAYGGAYHGGVAYGGAAYGGAYRGGAAYGGAAVAGYHYSPTYSNMYGGASGHPGGVAYEPK